MTARLHTGRKSEGFSSVFGRMFEGILPALVEKFEVAFGRNGRRISIGIGRILEGIRERGFEVFGGIFEGALRIFVEEFKVASGRNGRRFR